MSIATMRGDDGRTALAGGLRVSKSSERVEAYGTVDELISSLGFARAICHDDEIRIRTKTIQKELFALGSALATPPEGAKNPPVIADALVDALTADVHRIEAEPGILSDWSIPGEDPEAAAYDVARTVCRRAERLAVGLGEQGIEIQPNIVRYLNRLSDVLWLFGRLIELRAGVISKLREGEGPRWSRAW
jgi:cob(I)alamin adenosyltransferase